MEKTSVKARILDAIADDKNVISYRPRLREITKSATGAILLQQIIHRAKNNKWKPFYKFSAPCPHQDYQDGDSWTEELGFSEPEFENARNYIASKVVKGTSREKFSDSAIVFYWTDSNRKTWYQVNEQLLEMLLDELYNGEDAKAGILLYLEKRGLTVSKKSRNQPLHSSESTESTENIASQKVDDGGLQAELDAQVSTPRENLSGEQAIEITKTNLANLEKTMNPAVADPELSKKQWIDTVSQWLASALERPRESFDSVEAKRAHEKIGLANEVDTKKLKEFCIATRGTYKPKKPGDFVTARWVLGAFERWKSTGYKSSGLAKSAGDFSAWQIG